MNILISGGCKNGKSYYAQKLALSMAQEKSLPLYYLATMIPVDDEDRVRIERHLKEREGWGFDTIERGARHMRLSQRPVCIRRSSASRGCFSSGQRHRPSLQRDVPDGREGRSRGSRKSRLRPFGICPSEQEIPSSYRTTYILTHSHMNRSPKNTGAVWPAQIAGWPGYATGY